MSKMLALSSFIIHGQRKKKSGKQKIPTTACNRSLNVQNVVSHFTNCPIPVLTKRMATRCRTELRVLTDCRGFWRQERRLNVRGGNCSGMLLCHLWLLLFVLFKTDQHACLQDVSSNAASVVLFYAMRFESPERFLMLYFLQANAG